MRKEDLTLLSEGLIAGFAGETRRGKSTRGGFDFETSDYEAQGGRYHDEWIAGRVGGGQEVIEIDGKKFTRLYAGGTIALEELAELGLTKKDVIRYLKSKLKELGNKTRLLENCRVEDGDWDYDYFLLDVDSDIPLITAQEMIRFCGKRLFVHSFLLCPIE